MFDERVLVCRLRPGLDVQRWPVLCLEEQVIGDVRLQLGSSSDGTGQNVQSASVITHHVVLGTGKYTYEAAVFSYGQIRIFKYLKLLTVTWMNQTHISTSCNIR